MISSFFIFLDLNDSDILPSWSFGRGICTVSQGEVRRPLSILRPPDQGLLGFFPIEEGIFMCPLPDSHYRGPQPPFSLREDLLFPLLPNQ